MKDKKIVLAVIILLVFVGGGYFVLSSKKTSNVTSQSTTQSQGQMQQDVIPTISEEDIGLSLSSTFNNRKVIIQITKTSDLSSVDYELSYTSKGNVPRGIIGQLQIKPGKPVSQEIVLGTCSDVCHYDEDVLSVKLTLKVTKQDGNTYQLEKILNF